jgi:hypothetical protein
MMKHSVKRRTVGTSNFVELTGSGHGSEFLAADRRLLLRPESVQIRRGVVEYNWGKELHPVTVKESLWHHCAMLAKAETPEERVRRLASKWGPLAGHYVSSETLASWLSFARFVGAVDRTCQAMRKGEVGLEEDWKEVLPSVSRNLSPELVSSRPDSILRWVILCRAINEYYSRCGGQSVLGIVGGSATIQPHAAGVQGAVLLQLAQRVAKAFGVRICSGCKKRKVGAPRRGERRYCAVCRANGVPERDASRAYRARQLERKLLQGS